MGVESGLRGDDPRPHGTGGRHSAAARGRRVTLVLFLAASTHGHAGGAALSPQPQWQTLQPGISYASFTRSPPRIHGHVVRVLLSEPGLRVVVTPPNGDAPLETNGMRVTEFARSQGTVVAINAAPFSPRAQGSGTPMDVKGLAIAEGTQYSPSERGLPVLGFSGQRSYVQPPPGLPLEAAVAGFVVVLTDAVIRGRDGPRHPRTGAGVSTDGSVLFLMVIDGRQPGYSVGATTRELGQLLLWAGADDGLNLDGGGSTTLVLGTAGGWSVVNRPIDSVVPGIQRVVGSHLGVVLDGYP